MYSEILQPSKEEQRVNIACMITAVLLLLSTPYIYEICLNLPGIIGESVMVLLYVSIIALFYRVYTRFICGFRYAIVLEEQIKLLPRNMGVIKLKPGYIMIDKMYGSKGTTEVIIAPEEIKGIIPYDDDRYKAFIKETPLLNRKLFSNRDRKSMYALLYERDKKRYCCLMTPTEDFLKTINEFYIP